jgi:hypothetical protein
MTLCSLPAIPGGRKAAGFGGNAGAVFVVGDELGIGTAAFEPEESISNTFGAFFSDCPSAGEEAPIPLTPDLGGLVGGAPSFESKRSNSVGALLVPPFSRGAESRLRSVTASVIISSRLLFGAGDRGRREGDGARSNGSTD